MSAHTTFAHRLLVHLDTQPRSILQVNQTQNKTLSTVSYFYFPSTFLPKTMPVPTLLLVLPPFSCVHGLFPTLIT